MSTERAAAVARLAYLVPPARLDLLAVVIGRVGRHGPNQVSWPLVNMVHELVCRVGRVHRGEVQLRGLNGEVVDVIHYTDTR